MGMVMSTHNDMDMDTELTWTWAWWCPCTLTRSGVGTYACRYVALSRAKERLFLSHIDVEPSGGGEPATPSRFLTELPKHLVERVQCYA